MPQMPVTEIVKCSGHCRVVAVMMMLERRMGVAREASLPALQVQTGLSPRSGPRAAVPGCWFTRL
jgi:hypothetical protein